VWANGKICGFLKKIHFKEEDGGYSALNCNFRGEDLQNVKGQAHECSKKCQETKECTHFTWTPEKGGKCLLKKAENRQIQREHAVWATGKVCGFLKKIHFNGEDSGDWAMNCEFSGDDLKKVESQPQMCSRKCEATKECTHYTWFPDNGGECFLKRARDG